MIFFWLNEFLWLSWLWHSSSVRFEHHVEVLPFSFSCLSVGLSLFSAKCIFVSKTILEKEERGKTEEKRGRPRTRSSWTWTGASSGDLAPPDIAWPGIAPVELPPPLSLPATMLSSSTKSAAVTCSRLLRGGCSGNNGIAISWAGCRPLPPRQLARPSSGRPVSSADEDLSSSEGFKGWARRAMTILPWFFRSNRPSPQLQDPRPGRPAQVPRRQPSPDLHPGVRWGGHSLGFPRAVEEGQGGDRFSRWSCWGRLIFILCRRRRARSCWTLPRPWRRPRPSTRCLRRHPASPPQLRTSTRAGLSGASRRSLSTRWDMCKMQMEKRG